jgi:hypothetical protein
VVEVELDLVGRGTDGLITSELELLNEVLVSNLGEAATLLSIKVDVVYVEGGSDEASRVGAIHNLLDVGPGEVTELVELKVDLDLVVLEGNEGEGEASMTVEPELEGDVEGVVRGARTVLIGSVGLTAEAVVVTTTVDDLGEGVHEFRDVTNHLGVTGLLASRAGELVPDVEPVTVVLVNALTTDLNLNVLDEVVADPVEPAELGTGTILLSEGDGRESGLEVDTVDEITITGDGASYTLTEVGDTVEGLLNGFHREVGVAAIELLEESNLGVSSEIDILSTVSDELH